MNTSPREYEPVEFDASEYVDRLVASPSFREEVIGNHCGEVERAIAAGDVAAVRKLYATVAEETIDRVTTTHGCSGDRRLRAMHEAAEYRCWLFERDDRRASRQRFAEVVA